MPKLTKRANRYGRTDGQTDGPTLIIAKLRFKNCFSSRIRDNLEKHSLNQPRGKQLRSTTAILLVGKCTDFSKKGLFFIAFA